jgi:hypothetical protein
MTYPNDHHSSYPWIFMPKFGRTLARIVRHPATPRPSVPFPGRWERLATDEERQALVAETGVGQAA